MIIIWCMIVLYVVTSIFLLFGNYKTRNGKTEEMPTVSVIVAARNEEASILNCLQSLAAINYPESKIDFTIVNDRSNDGTGDIVNRFVRTNPKFNSIEINESNANLSGKAGAVSRAIQESKGKIIFITDADCTVPENWILYMVPYFDEPVGLVAGFVITQPVTEKYRLFDYLQALDLIYLLSVAAGTANWNLPLSCIGNNFAFRRETYNEIGGYDGVGFSLTEDFALLQSISQKTKWKVAFPIDKACVVSCQTLPTFRRFLIQRKRWATGGYYVRLSGKIILGIAYFSCIAMFIAFFLSAKSAVLALSTIIIADIGLLMFSLKRLARLSLIRYYLFFKIFHCFYILILPFTLLINRRIIWKDIKY